MRAGFGIALVLAAVAACNSDEIDVREVDPVKPRDYGNRALAEAEAAFRKSPESPQAFRQLVDRAEKLKPWTEAMEQEVELALVFAALGPMDAAFDRPVDEQLERLGTTVWPVAFEVPARPGESPRDYLTRLCDGELAIECRYVVPEHQPLVLARYAWHQLYSRARAAYAGCAVCTNDPAYAEAIERFGARHDEMLTRVSQLGDDAERSAWPIAGEHAAPWSEPVLFDRSGSAATLDGEPVRGGTWRESMRAARGDRDVLGVYLSPSDQVRTLRAVAEDASAAGYRELALLVRSPDYPYLRKEYRFVIGRRSRGAKRVRVRDVESIQSLVQAADATLGAGASALRL